jgi:hypothetical protein
MALEDPCEEEVEQLGGRGPGELVAGCVALGAIPFGLNLKAEFVGQFEKAEGDLFALESEALVSNRVGRG